MAEGLTHQRSYAFLQSIQNADLVCAERAVEDGELVEEPDVAQTEPNHVLIRIPREGLLSRAQLSPCLPVEVQPRDAIGPAGVVAYTMAIDGAIISASLGTVEFEASGTGTRLIYTEQGAF